MDRYAIVVRAALYLRTLKAPGWFGEQKRFNHTAMFGTLRDLERILPIQMEQEEGGADAGPVTIH